MVRHDVSWTNCAEQRSGADRANGSCVACGRHTCRGGSPPALGLTCDQPLMSSNEGGVSWGN
jgi:hypothetical protein